MYAKQKQIGEGKYAEVFLVSHKRTKMLYAVKCIAKSKLVDQEDVQALAQEIKIMKKMDHPNLVKLVDFYIEDDTYFLVQELMTGGELFEAIVKRVRARLAMRRWVHRAGVGRAVGMVAVVRRWA